MSDAGGQKCAQAVYEEARVVESKKELKKESNSQCELETTSMVDGEQFRGRERKAIHGGGKKLKQKQGSSEKEK